MAERGASRLGTVLTIAALVSVGVFLFYLNRQATQLPASAEEVSEEEQLVSAADLLASPTTHVGRRASIDSIRVAAGLGQAAFSLALDDSTAYPVLLNPDMIQRLRRANTSVYGGDLVYVGGSIFTLTDSIRSEWVAQGAVEEALQGSLPATPSFLFADSVVIY